MAKDHKQSNNDCSNRNTWEEKLTLKSFMKCRVEMPGNEMILHMISTFLEGKTYEGHLRKPLGLHLFIWIFPVLMFFKLIKTKMQLGKVHFCLLKEVYVKSTGENTPQKRKSSEQKIFPPKDLGFVCCIHFFFFAVFITALWYTEWTCDIYITKGRE